MVPRAAARSLIGAIDRYIAKADRDFRDEIEAEGFLVADEAAAAEEALEDGMTGVINEHVDDVLESLGNASNLEQYISETWPEIQDGAQLRDRLHDLFYAQFSRLLHAGVVAYLVNSDPDVGAAAEEDGRVTPYAVDFINGWSGKLAELMHLSTDRQINKILVDTAENHLSVSDATLAIGRSAIRSPGAKSRVVAQTEVLRVESYSQLEAMRQDPAVKEKEWFHTGSHKSMPRENHVAMSGQTVPVDQPFSLTGRDGGSYSPMVPRDTGLPAGESINCHCIMRQKKDSKVLGLSADERKALREKYLNQVEAEWASNNVDIATDASRGEKAIPYSERGIEIEERLRTYLEKLPEDGKYIKGKPDEFNLWDLPTLTTEAGAEFSIFDFGDRSYLVRGAERSTTISKELEDMIFEEKGRWRGHSHPFIGDLSPSRGDKKTLSKLIWQDESVIIDPTGRAAIFNAKGILELTQITAPKDLKYYLELFGDS